MDFLFSGVTIVTMDEALHVFFSAYLGVTDGKISYLSRQAPREQPKKILDGAGMVLLPGLIDCHSHLAMSLFRGYVGERELGSWTQAVLPLEDRLDKKAAGAAIRLALAQCLRFGITSVSDLYLYPEETAQAALDVGIKANIAPAFTYFASEMEEFDPETHPQWQEFVRLVETWHGREEGRIRIDAGLHASYTSNYRLWEPLSRLAREKGLGLQLHLGETAQEIEDSLERTGLHPAALLDCYHLLDVPVSAAPCCSLSPEDQALLARRGASAVVCPQASAMLGLAQPQAAELAKSGMNVALGTGSAAQRQDLFAEMRLLSLQSQLPPAAVLMMATVCGAKAQGRQRECGMLKVGMDADLILVDFTAPHLIPCHDVMRSLALSAGGSDVALTMVRGRILYAGGKFPTLDLDSTVHELVQDAVGRVFDPEDQGKR